MNTALLVARRFAAGVPVRSMATRTAITKSIPTASSALWLKRVPSVFAAKALPASVRTMATSAHTAASNAVPYVAGGLAVAGIAGLTYMGIQSAQKIESQVGMWPSFARERISTSFGYLAAGLGTAAVSAVLAFRSGVMITSPWVALGSGLVCMGTMWACMGTSYAENKTVKQLLYGAFSVMEGITLAGLGLYGGPLLAEAAMYTLLISGGMFTVASASNSDQFLWMGGPLAIGLGVVLCASIGRIFFPYQPFLRSITSYGGAALFSGFMLYDSSRMIHRAQTQPNYDPVNNALKLYLDMVNLFISLVQILGGQNRRK